MEFFLQGNVWVLQWGTVSASKGTTLQQGSVDFDASNRNCTPYISYSLELQG